ncbi:MAG: tRNA (adenosine(37)-N6)-threonylcarbamoyltransferase complex ATPase subunit type 1 TsaE [Verrucomicrobiales bacterium]|nr:tRNA (adenosine(37)-N6)-threonylcarbamoyltransferase complex ATPase subunit type 1 TsaE [Verrucomicrobiales bacterium]
MSEQIESTQTEEEMIEAGKRAAERFRAGDVVALVGDLGAGKTHFSKGIVLGLGSGDSVTSPTFSLVQEYRSGSLPVFHFDFYRLDSMEELLGIGWEEYLDEDGVVLVEWADKFPEALPAETIWYELSIAEDGTHVVKKR